MNRKAGAYARYSSDKQAPTSLEDQLRNCRKFVEAQGDLWLEEYVFTDAALSGTTEAGRDGYLRLKEVLSQRPSPIEYIVVDDLSRLNRDHAAAAALLRDLAFFGIELVSVSDGLRSTDPGAKFGFAIKSLMHEVSNDDLRAKTLRGLEGQMLRGYSTGGRIFGYRARRTTGPDDAKKNAEHVIHEEEAEVVRLVFKKAAEGESLTALVKMLNRRQLPCPDPGRKNRPKGWTYSSLRALLRNPKYVGHWIFKASRFVKDPRTGRRQRRWRPPEEWIIRDYPHLAIISKALFEKVKTVLDARGDRYKRSAKGRLSGQKVGATRASYLLSGIIRCGECRSAMVIYGGKKSSDGTKVYRGYRCPAAHRSGPTICKNVVTISREKIESAVLDTLLGSILTPECIAFFEEEFRKSYAETITSAGRQKQVSEIEREVETQRKKIGRLLDALENGESPALTGRLHEAERRLQELQADLRRLLSQNALPAPEPASKLLRASLVKFRRLLETRPEEGKDALRSLVGELLLTPRRVRGPKKDESRTTWNYEVSGSAFLQNILVPLDSGGPGCLSVIAGAGFEPATFGL